MPAASSKTVTELLGLPDPPKNGRERLVAAAIGLFYRQGFSAVGIDQIIAAAGVTKTTFYKHFEGKDDLMVAAVQRRDEWESQAWSRAVRKLAGDDPVKQLLAILDVMDVWFNDPEYYGCMFMNAATEFPNPNDPVHQAASEYRKKARNQWRDLARGRGGRHCRRDICRLLRGTYRRRADFAANPRSRRCRSSDSTGCGTIDCHVRLWRKSSRH